MRNDQIEKSRGIGKVAGDRQVDNLGDPGHSNGFWVTVLSWVAVAILKELILLCHAVVIVHLVDGRRGLGKLIWCLGDTLFCGIIRGHHD